MNVILSSNVPHYHYAAEALHNDGYLRRYITGVVPDRRIPARALSRFRRAKLEGRRLPPLPREQVVSLALPEVAQRLTAASHLLSRERSIQLQNALFDRLAARHVDRCDVFHFVSSIGLESARKAKRLGALIVCDERSEHPDAQMRVLPREYAELGIAYRPHVRIWEERVRAEYELSDHLIVGSGYSRETYVDSGWQAERVHVVPYGFEPNLFSPSPDGDLHGPFRILFCGQLTPRKGVHHLVRGFSELELPNAELHLVGPVDPQLAELVREWSRLPGVHLDGEAPKVELQAHYRRASVLVLPSVADAQPLVVLEAMACGLPAIVTTAMGSREIVRDGIDGFVVQPRDVDALKERLARLHSDRALLRSMAGSARERALEFTWHAYERRIARFYESLST
jgi:glycosyltransferase involved in cell wall biosynthesis